MHSWKKLLGYPFKEFATPALKVLKGQLPKALKGSLYRNSVAIMPRKNGLPGHLFDGDGIILKVHFPGDGTASAQYKFVETEGYKHEQQQNEYIYSGLGRLANGNRLARIFKEKDGKNTANTSVLPLKDGPLLALWEGGLPTALKKEKLETIGLWNGGAMHPKDPFSAHPKVSPETQLIYNVGNIMQKDPEVVFTEMDQKGRVLRIAKVPRPGMRFFIHDFVLAGRYLIVPVFPQFLESVFDHLTANKAFVDNLVYKPQEGIQVMLFDIEKFQLINTTIWKDDFYAWHYFNGKVDHEGNIVVTLPTYKNFDSFFNLQIVNFQKGIMPGAFKSQYSRLIISSKDGSLIRREVIHDDQIEFPVVEDADVGRAWDNSYACIASRKDDYFDGLVRYYNGDQRKTKIYEEGQYISEALHVQDPNRQKGSGWLLLTVYDGRVDKASVAVVDAESLEDVCQLELPQTIGLSFHGRFEQLQ